MNELAETKTCPFCAESIKQAAKVCPFCQSKQGRYAMWQQELSIMVFGLALATIAIVPVVMFAPEDNGIGGRSFTGHRDDLTVVETSLTRAGARGDFFLTGVVTNRGEHPWRVHELELRFLDAQGKLLDVRHLSARDPFVVLPRHQHGFREQIAELAFTNSNVSQHVRVQEATDGDRPLKPD